jgi:hypothetical protein
MLKKFLPILATSLFAATSGNPMAPGVLKEGFFIPSKVWVNLRAGYEGDFIIDGRMKQTAFGNGRVDDFYQEINGGTLTLNIFERLDLFGLFGASRVKAEWRFTTSAGAVNRVELQTHSDFTWASGARAILYRFGNAALGIGGRYEKAILNPSWLTINGQERPSGTGRIHWMQWQADAGLSYQIDWFIPYISVKYLNAKTRVQTFPVPISSSGLGKLRMENRTPVGLVLGCTLSTGKYFMLNLEGELIDEEAITISGDIRF